MLHILSELRPSGAEVMLRIAAPLWFLAAKPHAILATGRTEGSYANRLREAGFEIFHIPFGKKFTFFHQVRDLIRLGHFDAVHIHTEQAHVFYGLAARLAGVHRIVHTIHSVFPFTGLLRLSRIVMRRGLRSLGTIAVAIGKSVAENEERLFWNRTVMISNWYDDALFRRPSPQERTEARRAHGILEGQSVIATVGNCSEWKNHTVLLRALKLLQLKGRADWLFLHAGEEDPCESERSLATELGVGERCAFLGATADPRSVLWAADVFVMPSLREGLGNAAIEAAACGLPLVLTDVPGLRDFKAHVPDGFWVQAEPSAVAAAIELALAHFPAGSSANAASMRARFGVEIGAKAYYDLYNGVRSEISMQTASEELLF